MRGPGKLIQKLFAPKIELSWDGQFGRQLSADDLPALNKLLSDLERGLRAGAKSYRSGRNNGRDGVRISLTTVLLAIAHFDRLVELTGPIQALLGAVDALNQNNQLPLLTPTPASGRPATSILRARLEAIAVYTVEKLQEEGLSLEKACELVADELVALGIKSARGNEPISTRTIRNWKQRISEDVGVSTLQGQALLYFRANIPPALKAEGADDVAGYLTALSVHAELFLPGDLN